MAIVRSTSQGNTALLAPENMPSCSERGSTVDGNSKQEELGIPGPPVSSPLSEFMNVLKKRCRKIADVHIQTDNAKTPTFHVDDESCTSITLDEEEEGYSVLQRPSSLPSMRDIKLRKTQSLLMSPRPTSMPLLGKPKKKEEDRWRDGCFSSPLPRRNSQNAEWGNTSFITLPSRRLSDEDNLRDLIVDDSLPDTPSSFNQRPHSFSSGNQVSRVRGAGVTISDLPDYNAAVSLVQRKFAANVMESPTTPTSKARKSRMTSDLPSLPTRRASIENDDEFEEEVMKAIAKARRGSVQKKRQTTV